MLFALLVLALGSAAVSLVSAIVLSVLLRAVGGASFALLAVGRSALRTGLGWAMGCGLVGFAISGRHFATACRGVGGVEGMRCVYRALDGALGGALAGVTLGAILGVGLTGLAIARRQNLPAILHGCRGLAIGALLAGSGVGSLQYLQHLNTCGTAKAGACAFQSGVQSAIAGGIAAVVGAIAGFFLGKALGARSG